MRLIDFINQGGSIMYVLVFLNIIGTSILCWKLYLILKQKKQINVMAQEVYDSLPTANAERVDFRMTLVKDEVALKINQMEAGLNTIKIIANIAPLLGLLGTVVGIYDSFITISQAGLSNPALFAGGISLALITTIGGLIVAIPHFIGYNYLVGLLDDMEMELEKKSIAKLLIKA